mmetsp:Transcript_96615/g.134010  ORF Transcript_96615/g.134010 Transcript_96615/m.134010 type:complete len:230 (+) Transcript_96615:866-1555(+)
MASPRALTFSATSSVQMDIEPLISSSSAWAMESHVAFTSTLSSWQAAQLSAAAFISASWRTTPKALSLRPLFLSSSFACWMHIGLCVSLQARAAMPTVLRWNFFTTSSTSSFKPAMPAPARIASWQSFFWPSVVAASMQIWNRSPTTSTAASSLARFSLFCFLSSERPRKSSPATSSGSASSPMQRSKPVLSDSSMHDLMASFSDSFTRSCLMRFLSTSSSMGIRRLLA